MKYTLLLLTLALLCPLFAAPAQVDVLVFAPHPDDESLGCAGVLAQAVKQGKTAKVVLITGGDAFRTMAALITKKPVNQLGPEDAMTLTRFRQSQALQAITTMGLKASDLIMLGYPDGGGTERIYMAKDAVPIRNNFTQKNETYAVIQKDYHTATHGSPAPYIRASVLGDMVELLKTLRPKQIYVTSETEGGDHGASMRFVRDAAREVGFKGEFYTYVIHGVAGEWAWPYGPTPDQPFAAHKYDNSQGHVRGAPLGWIDLPFGVPWPPPHRVPLSKDLVEIKAKAIKAHSSHLEGAADPAMVRELKYLESFVKSEEIFWPIKID
jgi:LmbE family N-acetylglucosaminyl deacetylase